MERVVIMVIHILIYWLLCLFLLVHLFRKFLKTKNFNYFCISLIQLVFIIVQIVCLILKVEIDLFMQAIILIFNFILPIVVFTSDYFKSDLDEVINLKLGDHYARKGRYLKAPQGTPEQRQDD